MYVRKPIGPAWTPTALDIARAEEALRAPKPSYRKKFGHGTQRRRVEEEEAAALTGSPPTNILIDPAVIPEKTAAAIIGIVTVVDVDLPNDSHTFVISDSRFEIVDGVFKLKSGQQVVFASEATVSLSITATDQGGHPFSKIFSFTVSEQIVPDDNHAPTNIILDDLTVSDLTLGAVIGPVVGTDPDLPNDTLVLSVDDSRFVIIAGVLRLKPNKYVSSLLEPTVPLTLTATDAGGLSTSRLYTIAVSDIAAPDLNNAIFIAPTTQGAGSGTSFATALPFSSIATAITQAAATGKQVLMASHLGNYTAALRTLSSGGTAGAPVIVRGCDAAGNEDAATIVGTRVSPWNPAGNLGEEVFRFLAGANNLYFKNITFNNCGNGCFRFGDNVSGITIDTCNASNVNRFIENSVSGAATSASIAGLHVRNCLVEGYSRAFARISYASAGFLFENCFGDSLGQDGGHFAVGIGFEGTAGFGTVRGTTMRNHHDIISHTVDQYYNADGYSGELDNHGIEFIDCVASGNTDGGWDFKGGTIANPLVFTRCTSFNNKHNYKLWGNANLTDCVGLDVNNFGNVQTKSQVEIDGTSRGPTVINITNGHFASLRSNDVVFDMGADNFTTKTLTVVNTSIQKHASAVQLSNPHSAGPTSLDIVAGPNNTDLPTITGTDVAGDTITLATPGDYDEDVTLTYKFKIDIPGGVGYGIPIDDALGPTYATAIGDIGSTITLAEYATDADGNVTETLSASIGPIVASGIANTVAPSLSGLPYQGGILTADVGSWSGIPSPTFTVQFKMNGSVVQDSSARTYTVLLADVGKTPKITVHGDNGSSTANADSANYTVIGAKLAAAYIRPAAHGAGIANSWANATTWDQLGPLINSCAPGATIHVASFAYDGEFFIHSTVAKAVVGYGGTGSDLIVKLVDDDDPNMGQVPVFDSGADISGFITIQGSDLDLTPGLTKFRSNRTTWVRPFEGTLTDPFTTTSGSAVVNVHVPAHGLVGAGSGQKVGFWNQTAVGGITITNTQTLYYPITSIVDVDNFTITHTSSATSSASGGGTVAYEAVSYVNSWAAGWDMLELASGANNLKFSYLGFEAVQNCVVVRAGALLQNVWFDNCYAYNFRRLLTQAFSSVTPAQMTAFYFTDITATGWSKQAFQARGTSVKCVWDGLTMDSGRQSGDNFAVGIEISENADFLGIYNADIGNLHDDEGAGHFWNADSVSAELTNGTVIVQDCTFHGNTDAGFDIKCATAIMRRVSSSDNKHNLKQWAGNAPYLRLIDDCTLDAPRRRAGTDQNDCIAIYGSSGVSGNGADYTIINTAFSNGSAFSVPDAPYVNNTIMRMLEGNTFTNCTNTAKADTNTLTLNGLSTDVVAPTITSGNTSNAYNNARLVFPLTANEGVSWSIVGGADAAIFTISQSSGIASPTGQYLLMTKQAYTGGDDTRVVNVRATDANRNTTDQTITVTVLSAAPPYTFQCRFEGANNATTATDEAGGKTITFVGNAKLTTTTPLEGSSSLLVDGTGDYCSISDSADWQFTGEFSILAKFNAASLAASGTLVAQYDSTGGSNRAWQLTVTSAGEVLFYFSKDNSVFTTVQSSGAGLTTGVAHEVAVDRDENGKIRVYLDGAMVASTTVTGAFLNSASGMRIGSTQAAAPTAFNGRIDNVRIWNGYSFCASDSGYTP